MVPPSCCRMGGRAQGEPGTIRTSMDFRRPSVRQGARLAAISALLLLTACLADREVPTTDPTFYQSMAAAGAQVDAATAASMISGYRSNNGLTIVSVDPELMKLAQAQA